MKTLPIFLALFFIRTASSGQDECFTSTCDVDSTLPLIRFPFRIVGSQQPLQCGRRGFEITCNSSSGRPILQLKNSSFAVQQIDYANQHVWLNDPNNCLPRLLLTLNLSSTPITPFSAIFEEYRLFSCSESKTLLELEFSDPIDCLSGAGYDHYTVAAADLYGEYDELLGRASCKWIENVSVPVDWPFQDDWSSRVYAPDADIKLSWHEPVCGECESKGGICGPKRNSDHDVDCKFPEDMARRVRFIITMALGIPSSIIIFGALCFFLKRCNSVERRRREWQNSSIEISPVVISQSNTILGLGHAVIESIPKTVLSESMELDNTCPICLGEYKVKESIRTFSTCQHSFHSHCIDEWLHRNTTCPVCRKCQK